MNSKSVLSRIAKMLSLSDTTILEFTDAKTVEGTILQSKTFDLGEDVEVVSEDGTKSPAPDGEHEISLKDSEGKEIVIRIITKDGKITERENVEEAAPETEMEGEGDVVMEGEMPADVAMAKDYVEAPKGITSEVAKALPNTTDEDPRNSLGEDTDEENDPIISLTYRITELEKMYAGLVDKIAEKKEEIADIKTAKEEEIKVPKLDGAPIDETLSRVNLSGVHKPTTNKVGNAQNSFLSKLYN
jgi:hypothetical protein